MSPLQSYAFRIRANQKQPSPTSLRDPKGIKMNYPYYKFLAEQQSFLEAVGAASQGSLPLQQVLRSLDSSQGHCLSVVLVPHPIAWMALTPKSFFQKVSKCLPCQRSWVALQ